MDKLYRAAALGLSCVASGCLMPVVKPPSMTDRGNPAVENVVLVTVDGVRWQEIFEGVDADHASVANLPSGQPQRLTPNLRHLFFEGGTVIGAPGAGKPFEASGPFYSSLPSYTEMMQGVVSGCVSNNDLPKISWSVVSEIAGRSPGRGAAVFSSWETIARTIPRGDPNVVVNTGRQAGDSYAAEPGQGDYRPDQYTAKLALDYLDDHRPRFLWVSLGDTDEWAHHNDYAAYIQALRSADAFVGELWAKLEGMPEYHDKTTIIVTTDHGREWSFQEHFTHDAASVWLMARGGPIARKGPAQLSRIGHLRDLAPTILALYDVHTNTDGCDSCGAVLTELIDGHELHERSASMAAKARTESVVMKQSGSGTPLVAAKLR